MLNVVNKLKLYDDERIKKFFNFDYRWSLKRWRNVKEKPEPTIEKLNW
jgi:hypothetical protein